MQVFTTLTQRYQVENELAMLVQKQLRRKPLGMSLALYRRYTLMRLIGMSPQEADDFLGLMGLGGGR